MRNCIPGSCGKTPVRVSRLLCVLTVLLATTGALAAGPDIPHVRDVQRAALRYAGLDSELDRWSTRARAANLLPELQGHVTWLDQTDLQSRYREYLSHDAEGALLHESAQNTTTDDRRDRVYYGVRASLDLGRLVYDPAEVIAAREERIRVDLRQSILRDVTTRYFRWVRARTALEEIRRTRGEETALLEIELAEQAAFLDALTGGWFTQTTNGEVTR